MNLKKMIARKKAFALARKIMKTGCISRQWNIHPSDEGDSVLISAPIKELNILRKTMKIRSQISNRSLYNCEPREFWGFLKVRVL